MARSQRKGRPGASSAKRSRLKEAVVLIPLTYNDETKIPLELLESILDQVYRAFDGHTIEGTVKGTYRMQSGQKRAEDLIKVSIVLNENRVPELERMIAAWAAQLGQETMLLRITDSAVKFVGPQLPEQQT